jgi:UDP-glucose 4-epimerase
LVALATSDQAFGEVFNLGSNFESSIKDLAYKIKEMTGSNSEIAFIPFSQTQNRNGLYEDLVYRAPDLQKIRDLVGYDPKVDLDEALSRIIEDFKR